ncbi:MAG: hypothetical protein RPU52_00410 [Candidatus Sedimenticola sp. (ex Thyasira tokunagai)]
MNYREFDILLNEYINKFGHTFTSVCLSTEGMELAKKLMKEALAGKRGPVLDHDVGADVPPDAEI